MDRDNKYRINVDFLRKRLKSQDLKQWWVAEQIQVSERTITRWVNDQVKYSKAENIKKLASVLECTFTDLIIEPVEQPSAKASFWDVVSLEEAEKIFYQNRKFDAFCQLLQDNIEHCEVSEISKRYCVLSWVASQLGERFEAVGFAKKAVVFARDQDNKEILADALYGLAFALSAVGLFGQAEELVKEYSQYADSLPPNRQYIIQINIADIYAEHGRFDTAINLVEPLLEPSRADKYDLLYAHSLMGVLKREEFKLSEALEHLNIALSYSLEEDPTMVSSIQANLIRTLVLEGRTDEAFRLNEDFSKSVLTSDGDNQWDRCLVDAALAFAGREYEKVDRCLDRLFDRDIGPLAAATIYIERAMAEAMRIGKKGHFWDLMELSFRGMSAAGRIEAAERRYQSLGL